MNDDGSEARREPAGRLDTALGQYAPAVDAALAEAAKANVVERIWNRDASLWKDEASHQRIITNSLGWLTVPTQMQAVAEELRELRRRS